MHCSKALCVFCLFLVVVVLRHIRLGHAGTLTNISDKRKDAHITVSNKCRMATVLSHAEDTILPTVSDESTMSAVLDKRRNIHCLKSEYQPALPF